jgi:DNA-binding LacI/PurR family transcriptional regulator
MVMSGRDRPTLENVAQRAGVSRATASRVVNGSTSVAPHIRDKVLSAVEALGYVPNQAARSLVTQRTDSIALVASETASRVFSDDPFCNGRLLIQSSVPYVDVDNENAAGAAVHHLLDTGRRRVATIAGPQDMSAGIDRLKGYRSAMQDSGRRSLVAVGDFTRQSGALAMSQLLGDDPDLDAVFAASDAMAEGALRALRQAGRRVPDDVAVVGFDDMDFARDTEPPLTTVRQPITDLGRMAARQVLRMAGGEQIEPVLLLPTELVKRESA